MGAACSVQSGKRVVVADPSDDSSEKRCVQFDEDMDERDGGAKTVSPVASRRKTPFPRKRSIPNGAGDIEGGEDDDAQGVRFAAGTADDGGGGGGGSGSRPTIASRRKTPFPAKLSEEAADAINIGTEESCE